MAEIVLLDAGPLVALANRRDEFHAWALDQLTRLKDPLVSCGAVFAEAGFLLAHAGAAITRIRTQIECGNIVPAHDTFGLWQRCFTLMERYANVPMSFADAYLVALAEDRPTARIFTLDRDFLIYRRSDGQPLPLIAPFAA